MYGSDAMSGVVNFRTVRSLNGVRGDAMYSLSERGDAERMNALARHSAQKYAAVARQSDRDVQLHKAGSVNGSTRDFFHDKTPSSFIRSGTFVPSATNAAERCTCSADALYRLRHCWGTQSTAEPKDSTTIVRCSCRPGAVN